MHSWKKVKLGEILTESKVEAINSDADSRIRVLLNANGVIKRPLTKETKGATKYYKRSSGQFIYGKQNLHKGAFGIIPKELDGFTSSSDLPAFDIDKSCLPEWLDYFLKQGNFYLSLIDIAKGAATKRIQPRAFYEVEIPLPKTTVEQKKIIEGFKKKERLNELLNDEIQTQKQLLSQLKQSILQEAIEGKLTQEWRGQNPGIEPASELLDRIKAEKKQLIKDKKVRKGRKQKSNDLGNIKPIIPDSWIYADLDDISQFVTDGTHQTPTYTTKGRIFLSAQNVKPFKFMPEGHKYVSEKTFLEISKGKKTEKGDLLIGRVGSKGETAVIDRDLDFAFYVSLGFVKTFKNYTSPDYLAIVLNSPYGNLYATGNMSSIGASAGNFNLGRIRSFPIPFPSLEEQKVIVEKVEALMEKCNALEQEIIQSEEYANMLMQAVLKEAFENKTEKEKKIIKLNSRPTHIDYYKRTLLATEIIWQLHKEPTLGHLKLQKLIYLSQEVGNMKLPTNFSQQAAGPYDPQMARSLDKQIKTKKWFEYKKTELLKFKPLEKAGQHRVDFEKFFANEMKSIQYIIDTFKTAKSDQVEIVGTLYACWNKLIEDKQIISDNIIIQRFYEWSVEKERFEKDRLINALRWMETKGIYPK